MAELRSKLFLSYSRADSQWRDAFRKHLKGMFGATELWVDCESIPPGTRWEQAIASAIEQAHCALVLLTPAYLNLQGQARRELDLLLAQASRLKLLPVLVEECGWRDVPKLAEMQFTRWQGSEQPGPGGREALVPLDRSPDRESSIIAVCEFVKKEMGVVGQTRPEQIDALFDATQKALSAEIVLQKAVHSGTFSVVYRAKMHNQIVAVKAVPDAPRQNRIRQMVSEALPKIRELTDPAFIRLRDSSTETEPHYFVMDYVDWPTIEQRLRTVPHHAVEPRVVATILAQVARAQSDAHRVGLLIGPLSLGSIHANDKWQVRFSPLRIEGVLSRAAYMATGQLMNWDALTYLAPEVSAGKPAYGVSPGRLDALEQYYLGLLGLELLLGRPPCEVRCFDDLAIKVRFFEDPREFFDEGLGEALSWVDSCPALAYLLIRLLARMPEKRLSSAEMAARELQAVVDGNLPMCLRGQLEFDLDHIIKTPGFSDALYARLFTARPALAKRFSDRTRQAHMLAAALPDLVAFDPQFPRNSRFQELADRHSDYGIDSDDVEAFRSSFLAQVDVLFGGKAGHVEAWRAALDRGLEALAAQLPRH